MPRRLPAAPSSRAPFGLHRLTYAVLALHAVVLLLTISGFAAEGLSYVPSTGKMAVLVSVWALWAYLAVLEPGKRPGDFALTESLLVFALLLTFPFFAAPLQYVAVALRRPLVDGWLAAADSAMGVSVPAIVDWTGRQPLVPEVLRLAYNTLAPQFVLPILGLGLWYRDRHALWEFVFHFHVCVIVTIACLAAWPAACAFTYYGFTSLLDQTRFIHHFEGIRAGVMTVVSADDLEGLISMPSFHVAGGLMVTWAFRRYPVWFGALALLNLGLVASTVMTGAHYAVDIIATFILFATSVWVYRAWGIDRWHQWEGSEGALQPRRHPVGVL